MQLIFIFLNWKETLLANNICYCRWRGIRIWQPFWVRW